MDNTHLLRIIRYMISGGTSVGVLFVALFILHHTTAFSIVHISILSFILSTTTAFFLQKYWTWNDTRKTKTFVQMGVYISIMLIDIVLNGFIMNILINKFHLWYIYAQLITIACIVSGNYFLYDRFVFKNTVDIPEQ